MIEIRVSYRTLDGARPTPRRVLLATRIREAWRSWWRHRGEGAEDEMWHRWGYDR